jgi:DNA (cytosine-5)-methyltransferase 1
MEVPSQHEREEPLNEEEVRMNREAKQFHPFYNVMSFPDQLGRPARTVTATCTRVSRESIVIRDGHKDALRRLTLRERATLQGFPTAFEFFGSSYNANLKMVGNALPPLMAFYVAHSMQETPARDLPDLAEVDCRLPAKTERPVHSTPPRQAGRYPRGRRFRAALPHLRFGSGVRFELANHIDGDEVTWQVSFFFGTSKRIQSVALSEGLLLRARRRRAFAECFEALNRFGDKLNERYESRTGATLQQVWTHTTDGIHPFELVDDLGDLAVEVYDALSESGYPEAERFVLREIGGAGAAGVEAGPGNGTDKIRRHARWILAGFMAGAWFNSRSTLNGG